MNFISIGSAMMALSVILGAFGTHGLKGKVGYDLLEDFQTGTHYLLIHALGCILYGLWHRLAAKPETKQWPAILFVVGSIIFTGSLYLITFTEVRMWGAVTPVGGLLYIIAWIGFAIQAKKSSKN